MKVNFNGVRKSALRNCDELTTLLNEAIIRTDDEYASPNGYEHSINLNGFVLIEADALQSVMDNLRMLIGTIGMTYEEDNEDFKDVFEPMYPENEGMVCFNPEPE